MKIRLFRTPFEQINLLLPVLFVGICLVEYFSGYRQLWQYQDLMKYIQDLVFFNGLHVCLTFVFLATTSAGRTTMERFLMQTGTVGIIKVIVVFIGSAFIYYFVHSRYANGDLGFALFYLVLAALRRKHDLGQSKGLLRIANRQFIFNNPEYRTDMRFQRVQQVEHYVINMFYFTSLLSVLTYFDFGIQLGTWSKLAFQISFWASIALALIITVCAFVSPRIIRFWKVVYSVRFYLKVLGPFSAVAAYSGASIHGTEYVFVTDKILHSDQAANRRAPKLASVFTVIAIIFLGFAFIRYPELFLPSVNKDFSVPLVSIAAGIILTHFYVDYLIFTPKHEFARPLLQILSK